MPGPPPRWCSCSPPGAGQYPSPRASRPIWATTLRKIAFHMRPGLVPQADRRDWPGLRGAYCRPARRQRPLPAPRRPGRDRPGRQAPGRLKVACAIAAGDPRCRTVKGVLAAGIVQAPSDRPAWDGSVGAFLLDSDALLPPSRSPPLGNVVAVVVVMGTPPGQAESQELDPAANDHLNVRTPAAVTPSHRPGTAPLEPLPDSAGGRALGSSVYTLTGT